jgi:murein DD-endopeptidase MepM/ murein hydrolase activator NlpD
MKFRISSKYGELSELRNNQPHSGLDFSMPTGTELRSFMDGVVQQVVNYGSDNIGKGVIIRFDDGTTGIYGHLSKISVSPGESINKGELIGLSGNTGNSTGAHLHFGLKNENGEFIDPTPLANQVSDMSGAVETSGDSWFLDKYNDFSDWFVGKEVEFILKPLGNLFKDIGTGLWSWFIANLPDIMGYGTILAGAIIILSAMAGKGGIIKPLAWYAGAMIIAVCILGSV